MHINPNLLHTANISHPVIPKNIDPANLDVRFGKPSKVNLERERERGVMRGDSASRLKLEADLQEMISVTHRTDIEGQKEVFFPWYAFTRDLSPMSLFSPQRPMSCDNSDISVGQYLSPRRLPIRESAEGPLEFLTRVYRRPLRCSNRPLRLYHSQISSCRCSRQNDISFTFASRYEFLQSITYNQ